MVYVRHMQEQEDILMLFDFGNPDSMNQWRPINDGVMGGVSNCQFVVEDCRVGVFSGTVSLANNGGFASVRSRPARCDLRQYAGLELHARGDGKRYQLRMRDNPAFDGITYTVHFDTRQDIWQTIRFPFSHFKPTFRGRYVSGAPSLNLRMIYSFGLLIGSKQAGAFRLEVDWLCAYKEA